MTMGQSSYHKKAYAEVQRRVAVAKAQEAKPVELLRLECEAYNEFIQKAPANQFHTSAVRVLKDDRKRVCAVLARQEKARKWRQRQEKLRGKKEERQQRWERRQQAEAEYRESPEGIKEAACEVLSRIREREEDIARERRVGKKTMGVVDMAVLHSAGSDIVYMEEELEEYRKAYREKTGRKLRLNDCEKTD